MNFSKRPAIQCDFWQFVWIRFGLSALCMTMCWLQTARGQVAASIKGMVTDSSGVPVASATVTAKNAETGAMRTAIADDGAASRLFRWRLVLMKFR